MGLFDRLKAALASGKPPSPPLPEAPDSVAAQNLTGQGFDCHRANDFAGAIGFYDQALTLDPALFDTRLARGAAHHALAHAGAALADYEACAAARPADWRLPLNIARLHFALRDLGAAAAALNRAEAAGADPDEIAATRAMIAVGNHFITRLAAAERGAEYHGPLAAAAPDVIVAGKVLTAADCAAILALEPRLKAMEGGIGRIFTAGEIIPNARRSEVRWLPLMPETQGIYDKIADCLIAADRRFFHLNPRLPQIAQFAQYRGEVAGFYDWHADTYDDPFGNGRLISLSVQLSDPADYDGGALEIETAQGVIEGDRSQGAVILFRSSALHRVAPVTRGLRRSLVLWAMGPDA